jgi:ectoine hydroxylase-related dioxygenase (phytanoyl-CoA dioxygenase family)
VIQGTNMNVSTATQVNVDAAIIDEFAELGYAIIPDALPPRRVATLRDELTAAIEADLVSFEAEEKRTGRPHPDRWMVHNAMLRGPELARMLEHELMHAYFEKFLGATCILYSYQTSTLPPRGTNYGSRIHNDCPRLIPGYPTRMGAFFALDDMTEENGATYYLPGSQMRTEAPSEEEFMANAERALCPAGSLILVSSEVWHRGGENFTDRPRHALTIGATRSYMRSRFDFPRLIENTGSDILDRVGPVGRRFLGYNVRVPTSMEEYYLPPDQRLYLPNQG